MKRMLLSFLLVVAVSVGAWQFWRERQPASPSNQTDSYSYRTVDELFAIHRRDGWTLLKAPDDNHRYRICGAIYDDSPKSHQPFSEGAFTVGDGRTVNFRVPHPDGVALGVEGLDPQDGSQLRYVVLTRPYDATTKITGE